MSLGCGDKGDGTTSTKNSGITGTKVVTDFNLRDLSKLCEWKNALARSFPPISDEQICVSDAAKESTDSKDCERLANSCLALLEGEGPTGDSGGVKQENCSNLTEEDISTRCNATASELEQCIRDLYDETYVEVTEASCDELADFVPPASCTSFYSDCETVFF